MSEDRLKNILNDGGEPLSDKEIKEMKRFLFAEFSRLESERKRLKDEETLFDKKVEILKNGFLNLDLDRRQFERERKDYERQKQKQQQRSRIPFRKTYSATPDVSVFFRGVNNPLALRKRYRDLMKIFHPDNLCGDEAVVKAINDEFERLKRREDIS